MTKLSVCDNAFDAITAYHSLIHIPIQDHQSVIEEFARILRPDGRVLLTEGQEAWNGTNPDWLDSGVEMQWNIAGAEATQRVHTSPEQRTQTADFYLIRYAPADDDPHRYPRP